MATNQIRVFTSESVSEGHPDKVCDYIADSVLDRCLTQDQLSRVACEVLAKSNPVLLAGEITSEAQLNIGDLVRQAVREVGYTDPDVPFCADTLLIQRLITQQCPEIARGVNWDDQGAGDQGIIFGYATDETPELMPLPILLAHCLARTLAEDRRSGTPKWLRPDAKTQVSVRYEGDRPIAATDVLVSTQHAPSATCEQIEAYVREGLVPNVLGVWFVPETLIRINPAGSFVQGGPSADCGVTCRKTIVDSYGGTARHGGGAFSGKDPSKVDRSAAYFCRYLARQIVREGLARRVEIQASYAIGVAQPITMSVDTFGTGDARAAETFVRQFDFRPAAIVERLDLLRPIYRQTTSCGHFGKSALPWEQ